MANVDRFIRYAKIDTQADDTTHTTPSTEKQKDLSLLLVKELKELGLNDAYMDEWGVVYAHLKGEGEKIGFNAHVDTALEVTDTNVNPRIIYNYDGKDIKLNDEYTLTVSQFPFMIDHKGHDLVVTDGTTLLGADDKAGIAIIMSALEYLVNHPEIKHKNISVAFTPDEEIGEGPLHFDLKKMDADYAYTIDGSYTNGIDYENYNAKGVHIHAKGVSVHPGEGTNTLINAVLLLNEIIDALPKNDTPFDALEDGGYWHINRIEGNNEICDLDMILRDFDKEKLEKRVSLLEKAVKDVNQKYPTAHVELNIRDQYENMKPYVEANPRPLILAREVFKRNGIELVSKKIKGGTDGATFSKMGLVTPNLGTGSYNHHGRFEFLDIQEFEMMIKIVVDLMKS